MDLHGILKTASGTIRSLVEENEKLKRENEHFRTYAEAEKIAQVMHQKGIDTDRTLDELTGMLVKMAQEGNLDQFREAVNLVGPDMTAFSGLREGQRFGSSKSLAGYLTREEL